MNDVISNTQPDVMEHNLAPANGIDMGHVYWITGLSGAGKTTIGTRLYYRLRPQLAQIVLLDGDVIKKLFGPEGVDYSREGRKKRAFQYSELCRLLSNQGITVICCTIAMFDEVRQWNRTYIRNYHEIYINVDYEVLTRRDTKGLYKTYGEDSRVIVGAHTDAELPKRPDVIINNTMDSDVDKYVEEILAHSNRRHEPSNIPTGYWNDYYRNKLALENPSDFAVFVSSYTTPGSKLIDLGCGNGRDSVFFCEKNLKVTAVDLSAEAIQHINQKAYPIFAVCDDFVTAKALFCVDYDYCYARWSIHAIRKIQQDELIVNVSNALKNGGLFFIEVRTTSDSKYGMGERLGEDEYFHDGHYRRFIRPEAFAKQLKDNGFDIIYVKESDAFSVVGGDSPTLLRIIAQKCVKPLK